MGVNIWSNVQIAVQSALGANKTITAITKASPAVCTSTSHGLTNGTYVTLTVQGMWQLDQVVARIANVATNTFELEGIDATAYDTFTSGTAAEVTFGTTLSSVSDINVGGGDFDMIDVTTIHDNVKKTIPGSASPVEITLTANWDPTDVGLVALRNASDARGIRAIRFTFSDGKKWVFNGYIGATLSPTGQAQGKVSTPLKITAYGKPRTYTS